MRKADYAALAALIKKKREDAQHAELLGDEQQRIVCVCMRQTARDIAEDFARVASVNKTDFLKACGVT